MVRATGSYDEALDVWNSNFAPDALLLDFRLREGASGLDALAALRENGCDAPAILLTGDTEPHRVAAARAAGVPVMYKPVDVHQLLNAVESGIQSARKSAETST
jgi:CheY-like chemotaxis protein